MSCEEGIGEHFWSGEAVVGQWDEDWRGEGAIRKGGY